MKGREPEMTVCPWCGAAVPDERRSFPGVGEGATFLRCACGAVGLQTLEVGVGQVLLAEEVLGVSQRLWADPAWGVENVEWRIVERWRRLRKLEDLVSGPEIWVALVWGRRK